MILALPRTGTKMLCSALLSHPEIPQVTHEFTGGLWSFLKHPYVLSNHVKWWMRWPVKIIHLERESHVAGALSMIKMHYKFPDRSFDIPVSEVRSLVDFRARAQKKMKNRANQTISYEEITGGTNITEFSLEISHRLCDFLGVTRLRLRPSTIKEQKMRARNEGDIWQAA